MSAPAGYRESARRGTLLVARDDAHEALCEILRTETLHAWAASQPGARAMRGRGTTWATSLPAGPRVAVRHSRHGGMFAALTQDLFLAPTRAPRELDNALRLAAAGVRTPAVLGYAIYGVTGPLRRADVVTEFLDGTDFATALAAPGTDIDALIAAAKAVVASLAAAGASHADLNARNILLTPDGAAVLDVDRVTFRTGPAFAAAINAARLARSVRKLALGGTIPVGVSIRVGDALGIARVPEPR